MKILTTPEYTATELSLWKLVAAGSAFAPFAALLAFRNDCTGVWMSNRLTLIAAAVEAGALASFSVGIMAKFEKLLRNRKRQAVLMLVSILAALGLPGSAAVLDNDAQTRRRTPRADVRHPRLRLHNGVLEQLRDSVSGHTSAPKQRPCDPGAAPHT
jgi:hypothetical protein